MNGSIKKRFIILLKKQEYSKALLLLQSHKDKYIYTNLEYKYLEELLVIILDYIHKQTKIINTDINSVDFYDALTKHNYKLALEFLEKDNLNKDDDPFYILLSQLVKFTNELDNPDELSIEQLLEYQTKAIQEGIVLIPVYSENEKIKYLNINQKFGTIRAFKIEYDNQEYIVLRYYSKRGGPCIRDNEDIKKYRLKLMQTSNPNSYIFYLLGNAYQDSNIALAINYLMIAHYLSQIENLDYDFRLKINVLKKKLFNEKYKDVPIYIKYIIKLSSVLKQIKISRKIPIKTDNGAVYTIWNAIDNQDYKLALKYSEESGKTNNQLYYLLKMIVDLSATLEQNPNYELPNDLSKEEILDIENNLHENGIILIVINNPMEILKYLTLNEENEQIRCSIINSDKCYVLLRYYNPNSVNSEDIILGNQAFFNNDYHCAIKYYRDYLQSTLAPKPIIYYRLGYAYYKIGKIDLALDYLKVALILTPEMEKEYTKLINKIRELLQKRDNISLIYTFDPDDMYYGVINFLDIHNYIISTKNSVEYSLYSLGFNVNQVNIIKLIYARIFYARGQMTKGDEFVFSVEASNYQSDTVHDILLDLKLRKRQLEDDSYSFNIDLSLKAQ